jgi:predicted N-acetyltransferase YhbS
LPPIFIAELSGQGEAFSRLTYPRFVARLLELGPRAVAIGAVQDGQPVGLVLSVLESDTAARLLSLDVEEACRGQGIGSALLAACEAALAARGAAAVFAMHSSRTVARVAFERTLSSAGWEPTRLSALQVAAQCGRMLEGVRAWPSVKRLLKNSDYSFTPWVEIDAVDRDAADLLCRQQPCRALPALTPQPWQEVIEPKTSLAVRRGKRLVGWVLGERTPDAAEGVASIHHVAGYVDKELWRTGIMVAAFCDAFARQQAEFGSDSVARFMTSVETGAMFSFVRRRLSPLATTVHELLVTRKRLTAAGSRVRSGATATPRTASDRIFDCSLWTSADHRNEDRMASLHICE